LEKIFFYFFFYFCTEKSVFSHFRFKFNILVVQKVNLLIMKKLGLLVGVIALSIVAFSCEKNNKNDNTNKTDQASTESDSSDVVAKEYTGTYQGDWISSGNTIKAGAKVWIVGVTENQVFLESVIQLDKQSDGTFTGYGEALNAFVTMFYYDNEQFDKIENASVTATFSDDVLVMKITYDVTFIGVPAQATEMSFYGRKIPKENETQE
jgi:hypothetical protein